MDVTSIHLPKQSMCAMDDLRHFRFPIINGKNKPSPLKLSQVSRTTCTAINGVKFVYVDSSGSLWLCPWEMGTRVELQKIGQWYENFASMSDYVNHLERVYTCLLLEVTFRLYFHSKDIFLCNFFSDHF